MGTSVANLNKFENFKIQDFGISDYLKNVIGCGDKNHDKTIQYLNSLRSIEYLLNSYTELTFYKYTELSNIQHLALQLLPIFPEKLKEIDDESVEKLTKYLNENEFIKEDVRGINKSDAFLTSNFTIKKE